MSRVVYYMPSLKINQNHYENKPSIESSETSRIVTNNTWEKLQISEGQILKELLQHLVVLKQRPEVKRSRHP